MYAELKENHPHGTREYPFCEYHMRYWPHAFQIPVHWHDEVEIIYVRKGPLMVEIDGQKFIGDDTLGRGVVCAGPPRRPHQL